MWFRGHQNLKDTVHTFTALCMTIQFWHLKFWGDQKSYNVKAKQLAVCDLQ
jgi:hypothetical protein